MADPLFRSKLIALQASENSALFNANKLRDIPVLPIIPADLQVLTYSKTSGGWLPTASSSTAGNLTGPITSVGLATSVASQTGTGSKFVMDTSPTLVTPNLGTPTALVGTNITGTAAGFTAGSVTTNANLTGDITSAGNATTLATVNANVGSYGSATAVSIVTVNAKGLVTAASNTTITPAVGSITGLGTGVAAALAIAVGSAGAPVLYGAALGTPASGVATNLTGTAAGLTAGNVTTNANLTGDVTSVGNATTLTNAPVIAKVLTGYVSGAGTVAATDSILQAIQKLNGNNATNANLTGMVTSVGNATTVVTNANLTGDVTSSGNATTIGTAKVTNAMLASNASPSIGIGYATGAGATVTQATSRTTGVTINAICGSVVTSTASLAAGVTASFTVTNSSVAISDVVLCSIRSGQTNKATRAIVSTTAAGSFEITVTNRGDGTWAGAAEVGAIVINFVIIKAVTA